MIGQQTYGAPQQRPKEPYYLVIQTYYGLGSLCLLTLMDVKFKQRGRQ
jgi:hypothetical protein